MIGMVTSDPTDRSPAPPVPATGPAQRASRRVDLFVRFDPRPRRSGVGRESSTSSGRPPRKGFWNDKPAVPQGSPQKSSAAPQPGGVPPQIGAQAVEDQHVTTTQPGGLERASYGSGRPHRSGSRRARTPSPPRRPARPRATPPGRGPSRGARLVAGQQPAVGVVAGRGSPPAASRAARGAIDSSTARACPSRAGRPSRPARPRACSSSRATRW